MPVPSRDPTFTHAADAPPSASGGDAATGGPDPPPGVFRFPPPDHPGDLGRLGRYRVRKELGRGGMGAVFLGFDDQLGRKVAIKVMLPQFAADPVARERFLREARTAARVRSDHVVDIYDVNEAGGAVYIAMRFLDGCPLDGHLRAHGRLTVPQVLRVGREAAEGLAAAHDTGLIHRDIKLGNLWLEAPHGRVVLLDFGLAKPIADAGAAELTGSGAVLGTPGYMAPEQARGRELDGRADLFSLGVVLYRLATGHPPFPGPNVMAVLAAVLADEPRPVRELAPDVPPPLADLIHRLMAKDPARRPPTARGVSAALAAIELGLAGGEVSAGDPVPLAADGGFVPIPVDANPDAAFAGLGDPAALPPPPPRRRSRLLAGSLAAAAVVAAAGGAAVWLATRPDPRPEPEFVGDPRPNATRPAVARKTDPDRDLARWVLARRGIVGLDGGAAQAFRGVPLPAGPFRVTAASLWFGDPPADPDLDRFAVDSLTSLEFRGPDLTDDGLKRLGGFAFAPKLTRLSLSAPRLTDAGGAHLTRFPNLTVLWVRDSPNLTDDGLAFLANVPALTLLDLQGCSGFTGAGLRHGAGGKIAKLNLTSCKKAGDAGLEVVAGWPKIAELTLGDTAVTDAGLPHLAGLTRLRQLSVPGTKVTGEGVRKLSVALPGCRIAWDGGTIEPSSPILKARPVLDWVLKAGGTVEVEAGGKTRYIETTDNLPADARLTSLGFAIQNLIRPELKAADGIGVGEAIAAGLKDLPPTAWTDGKSTLSVGYGRISADGWVALADVPGLRPVTSLGTVGVPGSAVTPQLHKFPRLTFLMLNSAPVTDDDLKRIADHPALREVVFSRVGGLSAAGLGELRRSRLERLIFGQTPLAAAAADALAGIGGLTILSVSKSGLSAGAVMKLAAALPKCKITWDEGVIGPREK